MDTRWRNRLIVFVFALLFVFGLSGPLTMIAMGGNYLHRDYYHTPEFRGQLEQFANYLNLFELNAISPEDAKASIAVSEDEINEYRNGLGTLTDTIDNLKFEYEQRIEEAVAAGNQEAMEFYTAERDQRIEETTKVFKDEEYAKTLIMENKEQRIEGYYEERENYRGEYLNYKKQFEYYFKNSVNGKVFTSLGVLQERSASREMNAENKVFTASYTIPADHSVHYWIQGFDLIDPSLDPYDGLIAVSDTSPVVLKADRYRQEQIVWLVYAMASIAALLVCFYRYKKVRALPVEQGNWTLFYNKLPIDVKGLLLLATGLSSIGLMLSVSYQFHAVFDRPWSYGMKQLIITVIAAACWSVTVVQGQLLAAERLNWENFKREWRQGLSIKAGRRIKAYFVHAISSLSDAFLIKSTGTQLVTLLLVVFGLGAAGSLTLYELEPLSTTIYIIVFVVIGLPIVLLLVNKVAYFNRIAKAANELAAGSAGQELAVTGKSALTGLAANLNVLKRGVRTLQNEQARSERLKTELITNVSHDLRTPLTSIITYTGLLKAEDVSTEERLAYIDIIDKKSKRLKVLIDDLFEVSKMASGNVELSLAKADLVQLLQQALAEYDDAIEGSTVQFRVSTPETPVYASVDGQKLWRVFDNLIGNMVKYSLEHSRAYITIRIEDHHQVHITFKNVSKYEYSENGEELLERFKRGDTSRHTEGSGLGLAIAKSIVDLHEGRLDIETDGDLFKVIVVLKLT
ncbi:sensor histidine kinase [Paenibacillus harenae]|uniref:histidine kinase n=1 Tax=Paenibacillus harenae TaxID=306543 RepID=A0ABT9U8J7_PAEHA|nr:HAMP domain-containing sensor histidine kinase [Paenibacillus harenae]MDQ0115978.1 signal transduction histidine kinase [Paenibacillus harenae]